MEGRFISYLRVSTQKQNSSGLGLEAQREAITRYLNGGNWSLLGEYVETESGKRSDNRPILQAALQHCKRAKATLIIAKLDRLSRNVAFIAALMDSGVDFVAVDMPHANKLTVHILAAIAEHEREMISQRTREALQAAKARGVKLGNPRGWEGKSRNSNPEKANLKRTELAEEFSKQMYPIIKGLLDEGLSLNGIAKVMTERGELTPRGKTAWTATTVRNAIRRAEVV